ncbi:ATP-binding protein [Microbacterium sp. NPDC089987]|uniref:ATP-binding protein n=1 Tax=Microbacterium sp. NPDC089987 TaxID=3364202 RepID=UPI0037FC1753
MRHAVDNPFNPGSDVIPAVWAGRTAQLSDWRDVVRPRRLAGLYERGRTILGEPGLGKSTLVRRIAKEAAAAGDWVTQQLRVPSGSDPLKLVATALLKLADDAGLPASRERRIADAISRVQAVAVSGIGLTLRDRQGPEPHAALTDLLVEIGTAAAERGDVMVLIHLDEVQNITDGEVLSQLLIALGDAIVHEIEVDVPGGRVERTLPIAVYLTGLPDFEDMARARKVATFARRFKTETLAPLSDDDLAAALQDFVLRGWDVPDGSGGTVPIRMEKQAAAKIVDLCRGEPFLFQLAGEQAWYAGGTRVITTDQVRQGWRSAQREATAHIERILDRLPRREKQFVEAMASLPVAERTLSRIAEMMGLSKATDAGTTSQRLDRERGIIDRGRLYSFRHRALEAFLTTSWPEV